MKLVYILIVLTGGDVLRMQQPIFFSKLSSCTHTALALSRQGYKYNYPKPKHEVFARCEPRWVKIGVKTF